MTGDAPRTSVLPISAVILLLFFCFKFLVINSDRPFIFYIVFYIRSICGSISAPLSWWPTKGIPSYQLVSMFWEAVCLCEIHDVQVVAVVADGAATNKHCFDTIHGSKFNHTEAFTAPNPCDEARVIYICTDNSHLLQVQYYGFDLNVSVCYSALCL